MLPRDVGKMAHANREYPTFGGAFLALVIPHLTTAVLETDADHHRPGREPRALLASASYQGAGGNSLHHAARRQWPVMARRGVRGSGIFIGKSGRPPHSGVCSRALRKQGVVPKSLRGPGIAEDVDDFAQPWQRDGRCRCLVEPEVERCPLAAGPSPSMALDSEVGYGESLGSLCGSFWLHAGSACTRSARRMLVGCHTRLSA